MTSTLFDMKMIQYEEDYEFVRLINGIEMSEDMDKLVLLVFQPVDEDSKDYPDFAYGKKEENDITYFKIPCLKRRMRMVDFDYFRSLFTKIWHEELLKDDDQLNDINMYILIDISSEEERSKFATEDLRRFAAIAMNEMYHLSINPKKITIYVMAKEVKMPDYDIPADLFRESFEYVGKRDVRSKKDKKKKGKKKERSAKEIKKK